MLTKGLGACLVLDMVPTDLNRKLAKEQLKNTPFEVTFLYGSNPLEPVALAKTKIEKDPFKYKSNPDTPPASLKLVSNDITGNVLKEIKVADCETLSNSTDEATDNYSKQSIINTVKSIFFKSEPGNVELYRFDHFSNKAIYEQVEKRLAKPETACSIYTFSRWLSEETAYLGATVMKRETGTGITIEGRPL